MTGKRRFDIPEATLRTLYLEQRLSPEAIAEIYRCRDITVRRELKRKGIPMRSHAEAMRLRSIVLPEDELRELYLERQLTPKAIGEIFGCSEGKVRSELKRYGIPLRTRSQARQLVSGTAFISREIIEELYYDRGLSQEQIAAKLGCGLATVSRRMQEYGLATRSLAEAGTVYPKRDFSGDPTERAYLIGFRIGDLRVSMVKKGGQSKTIRVECSSTRTEQIDLIRELFEAYGHVWIGRPRGKDGKRVDIVCHLNMSFSFLLLKEDQVAEWIEGCGKNMSAFVAGYIDAEGRIGLNKGKAECVIDSYDKGVLRQMYEWFLMQDIQCPAPRVVKKQGSMGSGGYPYRQDLWRLAVYRKRSLLKLFDLIAPYLKHAKRRRDMKQAIQNIRERNERHGQYLPISHSIGGKVYVQQS